MSDQAGRANPCPSKARWRTPGGILVSSCGFPNDGHPWHGGPIMRRKKDGTPRAGEHVIWHTKDQWTSGEDGAVLVLPEKS